MPNSSKLLGSEFINTLAPQLQQRTETSLSRSALAEQLGFPQKYSLQETANAFPLPSL